ncbi:MAG TPA: hypothetical protein VGW12_11000 [Pyrinomonadaceae bacterium]|nr:hypothetical protein [Pyrinomonadaceae bacterium]
MRRYVRTSLVVALSVSMLSSLLLLQPFGGIVSAQKRSAAAQPLVARVNIKDRAEVARFVALGLDMLEMREGDDFFILTSPAEVKRLRAQGWKISVDGRQTTLLRRQRPDLKQNRAQAAATADKTQAGAASYMGGYLTVPEMRAFVDDRAARYPNLAESFVYGNSWQRINKGAAFGHELFGIKLTNKAREQGNGLPRSDAP